MSAEVLPLGFAGGDAVSSTGGILLGSAGGDGSEGGNTVGSAAGTSAGTLASTPLVAAATSEPLSLGLVGSEAVSSVSGTLLGSADGHGAEGGGTVGLAAETFRFDSPVPSLFATASISIAMCGIATCGMTALT